MELNPSKEYKLLYSIFSNYDLPASDSLTTSDWLKELKKSNKYTTMISANYLLSALVENDMLIKINNNGYIPVDNYYKEGLFEVKECTTLAPNCKSKKYTIMFTVKGREILLPFVEELITKKQEEDKLAKI